jgi:DNA-binding transcriptional regulator YhcF (GntR family)
VTVGRPPAAVLQVDTDDPTPPYEQVRRQLTDLVTSGVLRVGQRLPPLRQLAADLGLAVGTVARAYRELEAAGLVESRRGGGTRVAAVAPRPARELEAALAEDAGAYARRARLLGVSEDDAIRLLRQAFTAQDAPGTSPG